MSLSADLRKLLLTGVETGGVDEKQNGLAMASPWHRQTGSNSSPLP